VRPARLRLPLRAYQAAAVELLMEHVTLAGVPLGATVHVLASTEKSTLSVDAYTTAPHRTAPHHTTPHHTTPHHTAQGEAGGGRNAVHHWSVYRYAVARSGGACLRRGGGGGRPYGGASAITEPAHAGGVSRHSDQRGQNQNNAQSHLRAENLKKELKKGSATVRGGGGGGQTQMRDSVSRSACVSAVVSRVSQMNERTNPTHQRNERSNSEIGNEANPLHLMEERNDWGEGTRAGLAFALFACVRGDGHYTIERNTRTSNRCGNRKIEVTAEQRGGQDMRTRGIWHTHTHTENRKTQWLGCTGPYMALLASITPPTSATSSLRTAQHSTAQHSTAQHSTAQ
jgi:hypothetical protein